MTFETTYDKIKFYRRFEIEGTELADAVHCLLSAANILDGISCDHELALTLLAAENVIRDYMEYARDRGVDWDEYESIDPELYTYMLGGARKLTQEEYGEPSWRGFEPGDMVRYKIYLQRQKEEK